MIDEQYRDIWLQALESLKSRINMSTYETFFKNMTLAGYYDGLFVVAANNETTAQLLPAVHLQTLAGILEDINGGDVSLKVVSYPEEADALANREREKKAPGNGRSGLLLGQYRIDPLNTFQNFVVGNSNQFAHAASLAIAENMALSLTEKKIYNPLFIYGGSGLGKTHLMHAIAHHIIDSQPEARIIYVSSENFTNEMIDSIRDNKTVRFRSKYRKVDVLLIDDIQFLAKKEGTQEEFFHTFNELYEANKQIIISSDRPPNEIPTLEERLRTRFEWGLITDIQPPDLETRIAILRKKAQMDNKSVSDEVTMFMAEHMQTNIRELEGALLSLTAYANINNVPLDLDLAKGLLKPYLKNGAKEINAETIKNKISETYGVSKDDLVGKKRKHDIAYPRQLAMYLCREMTTMSLPKIGKEFGGRDHTTVMYAIEKIEKEMKEEPIVKATVQNMMKDLRGE